jgi:hypothetical protein
VKEALVASADHIAARAPSIAGAGASTSATGVVTAHGVLYAGAVDGSSDRRVCGQLGRSGFPCLSEVEG